MERFRLSLCLIMALLLLLPVGVVLAVTPTVTNDGGTNNITCNSSTLRGNVTSLGDASNVTSRFYWGLTDGGTTEGNWTNNTTATYPSQPMETGDFSCDATGLSFHTIYYYRAYTSGNGTAWAGSSETFTTLYGVPNVGNGSASPVYQNFTTLRGDLFDTGGTASDNATVIIYWGLVDGGIVSGNWTHSENLGAKAVGTFSKEISGLIGSTVYYFRCYASNPDASDWADSTGSFTTLAPGVAVVTTNAATGVGETGATVSCNLTNDGGLPCSVWVAYGPDMTCGYHTGYATSQSTGYVFSEAVGSLDPGTKYYFRGVAQNTEGVSYGTVEHFTTLGVSLSSPDKMEILSTRVFSGIGEAGDEIFVIRYNLEYEYEPDELPEDYFSMNIYDGDALLYTAPLYYYQEGIASVYLNPSHALGVGGCDNITIEMAGGNSVAHVLVVGDYESDASLFCPYLLTQMKYLERERKEDLVTDDNLLNSAGAAILKKGVTGVQYVCPSIYSKVLVPLVVENVTFNRTYERELSNMTGSKLSGALNSIGRIFGMSGAWVGFGVSGLLFAMMAGGIYGATKDGGAALILSLSVLFPLALFALFGLTLLFIIVLVITVLFAILFILGRFA